MCATCDQVDVMVEVAVDELRKALSDVRHPESGMAASEPHPESKISCLAMNLVEAGVAEALRSGAHPVTAIQMAADMVSRTVQRLVPGAKVLIGAGQVEDGDEDGMPEPVNKIPC